MSDVVSVVGTVAVAASAVVTAVMAWYTRGLAQRTADMAVTAQDELAAIVEQGRSIEQQAVATAEQVALARSSLIAQVQPWLTLGDDERDADAQEVAGAMFSGVIPRFVVTTMSGRLRVSVAVRNVGNGLAILDGPSSFVIGWKDPRAGVDELMPFTNGSIANPVLPAGEQTRVTFDVATDRWHTDIESLTHQRQNYGEFAVDIVYGDVLSAERTRLRLMIAKTEQAGAWVVHRLDYYSPTDAPSPGLSVRVT